jgi:CspA family cold shock protein
MLGWPHLLRAYAQILVSRELAALEPERQQRLVEDLVRSGRIASLVTQGGSIFVQAASSQNATPDVVEFFDDPAWFDDEVGRWVELLGWRMKEALATLGNARVVLIGGPCSYSRFQVTERQTGHIKLYNGDKGFGFIAPDEGGADVFFHIKSVHTAEGVELREDLAVEFDIGQGRRGPEAQRVTSVPPLKGWLRLRTVVSPRGLASGARECLLRLDTGSLTWREWLLELSLEVVRDGHFGELPLLERGTFVDPFLGDAVQFTGSQCQKPLRSHAGTGGSPSRCGSVARGVVRLRGKRVSTPRRFPSITTSVHASSCPTATVWTTATSSLWSPHRRTTHRSPG